MPTANLPVSVRVTPNERDLLEAAATQARTSLSDFIRRHALEGAELELLGRGSSPSPLPTGNTSSLGARPAKTVPALQKLSATSRYGRTDATASAGRQ